jgi:hypothetical protein
MMALIISPHSSHFAKRESVHQREGRNDLHVKTLIDRYGEKAKKRSKNRRKRLKDGQRPIAAVPATAI